MKKVDESFFFKWFHGPLKVLNIYRELAYTVGKGFSRNNFLDWFTAFLETKKLNGRENIYLSIGFYHSPDDAPEYHYLYFDFDSEENIKHAEKEAKQFIQYLKNRFNCSSIIVFSGCKGYNIIVPLNRPVSFETYRALWLTLTSPFTFQTLDTKVLDPRRVHRIPYTYNIKNNKRNLAQILNDHFKPVNPKAFTWEAYEPLKLDNIKVYRVRVNIPKPKIIYAAKTVRGKPLPSKVEKLSSCEAVPPCIRNIIEAFVKTGNLDHYQRLALTLYLKWVGFNIEQVIEIFRNYGEDFNEKITRYQVEYLYGLRGKRENWLMYSCNKLKQLNICLECGWNKNPVTYTYMKAKVPNEIKEQYYTLRKKVKAKPELHAEDNLEAIKEFIKETGLKEFTYDDFKLWLERKGKIKASEWHTWERKLRMLAAQGYLGRKFLINGKWIDYGAGEISDSLPGRKVKFYIN